MTIDAKIKALEAQIEELKRKQTDINEIEQQLLRCLLPPNVRIYQRCPSDARFDDYWICDLGNYTFKGADNEITTKEYAKLVNAVWTMYENVIKMFPDAKIIPTPELVLNYRSVI